MKFKYLSILLNIIIIIEVFIYYHFNTILKLNDKFNDRLSLKKHFDNWLCER